MSRLPKLDTAEAVLDWAYEQWDNYQFTGQSQSFGTRLDHKAAAYIAECVRLRQEVDKVIYDADGLDSVQVYVSAIRNAINPSESKSDK